MKVGIWTERVVVMYTSFIIMGLNQGDIVWISRGNVTVEIGKVVVLDNDKGDIGAITRIHEIRKK